MDFDAMKKQALKEESWFVVYNDTKTEFITTFPTELEALIFCESINQFGDGDDYAVVPRKIWNELSWRDLVDTYGYTEDEEELPF